MVGMILATADQRHIALDFLVTRAGPRQRVALTILHHAVLTGACAYAAYLLLGVRAARRRDRPDQHGARHPDGDPAFRAVRRLCRHDDREPLLLLAALSRSSLRAEQPA